MFIKTSETFQMKCKLYGNQKYYRGVKNKTPPLKVEIWQFWKHGFIFAKKSQNLGGFAKILADIWTRFDHLFSRFPLAMRSKNPKNFLARFARQFQIFGAGFYFCQKSHEFLMGGQSVFFQPNWDRGPNTIPWIFRIFAGCRPRNLRA